MLRLAAITLLVLSGLRAAEAPREYGIIDDLVKAFGPSAPAGKLATAIAQGKTGDLWYFRGIPHDLGSLFLKMDNPMGKVIVTVWIHQGMPTGDAPSWFVFGFKPKGIAAEDGNRADRDQKIADVMRPAGSLVPAEAKANLRKVFDALGCSNDAEADFRAFVQRFGDAKQYASIIAAEPRLRGGPVIGIELDPRWTAEVAPHHNLDPDAKNTLFVTLLRGFNDTEPFEKCYSTAMRSWQSWPRYNPFQVPTSEE